MIYVRLLVYINIFDGRETAKKTNHLKNEKREFHERKMTDVRLTQYI